MNTRIATKWAVVAIAAIAAVTSADALSVTYTQIIDLGTLGGASSCANALNDMGQVVGYSHNGSREEAFLWDPATGMTQLGFWGAGPSYATDINDAGFVTGYYVMGSGCTGFLWDPVFGMGSLPGTSNLVYSWGMGINDSGQVAGYGGGSASKKAFRITGYTRTDLSTPGNASSYATGLNDAGRVVGYYTTSSYTQAVYWSPSLDRINLQSWGSNSWATDVNNANQAVGYIDMYGLADEAVLWEGSYGTRLHPYDGTSSYAYGINDSTMIVGQRDSGSRDEAFVWEEDSGMVNLSSLTGVAGMGDWQYLMCAYDINTGGDIVGYGLTAGGETHAFLLLTGTVVPEPASVTLLGIGLAGLVCRGMRRSRERA